MKSIEDKTVMDTTSPAFHNGQVVIHIKHNRLYEIVSYNAMVKVNGEWVPAVIYKPLYPNEHEMFTRTKASFILEFELYPCEHKIP